MALSAEKLEYFRKYREAHRESAREAQKRWYQKNGKANRERRAETIRENGKAYYHRSKNTEKALACKEAHKADKYTYHARWQKQHLVELRKYKWLNSHRDVIGIPPSPATNCEICGSDKRISMDHCHKSNRFRGWLCQKCNAALGMAGENTEVLAAMIRYLEKFNTKESQRKDTTSD